MDRESVVEVIQTFYQCRLANDVDSCLDQFGPEALVRIAGSPAASPIAGSSMRGTLRQHLAALVADWEWRSIEIESMIIDGDEVAVRYRLRTRYVPTGDVIASEVMDAITLKDGRIASFVQFVDTATTAALAAKRGR